MAAPAAAAVPPGDKLLLVLVGLPARGKSYMSNKLTSFLRWRGVAAESFNVGAARRKVESTGESSSAAAFFAAGNAAASALRERLAMDVLHSALAWLHSGPDGSVAILDATNTTRARRLHLLEAISEWTAARALLPGAVGELRRRGSGEQQRVSCACCAPAAAATNLPYVIFLELICNNADIVASNMLQKITNSPDYRDRPVEDALADLRARIKEYEAVYQTVDEEFEDATSPLGPISYIKLEDLQSKVVSRRVFGHVAYTILSFLVVVHIGQRPIWLVRSGQCTDDVVRAMVQASMDAEVATAAAQLQVAAAAATVAPAGAGGGSVALAAAAAAASAAGAADGSSGSGGAALLSSRQAHALEVAAHRYRDKRGDEAAAAAAAAAAAMTQQLQRQRHAGGFSGAGVLHLYKGLASLSPQMATSALSAGLTLNDSGVTFSRMLAGFVLRRTAGGALLRPAARHQGGAAVRQPQPQPQPHLSGCAHAAASCATHPAPSSSGLVGGGSVRDAGLGHQRAAADAHAPSTAGASDSSGSASASEGEEEEPRLVSTATVPPPVHAAPMLASASSSLLPPPSPACVAEPASPRAASQPSDLRAPAARGGGSRLHAASASSPYSPVAELVTDLSSLDVASSGSYTSGYASDSPRASALSRAGSSARLDLRGSLLAGHRGELPPRLHHFSHGRSVMHVSALDVLRPIRVSVLDSMVGGGAGGLAGSSSSAAAAAAGGGSSSERLAGGLLASSSSGSSASETNSLLQLLPGSPGQIKSPGNFTRRLVRRRPAPAAGAPTEEQQEEEKGGFADNEETGGGDAPRVAIGFSAYPPRSVESFGGAPPDDVDEDAEAGIVVSAATVAQNNHYRAASAPGLPLASPAACDGASREAPLLMTPGAGAGAGAAAAAAAAGSAPAPTAGDDAGVPAPARRSGIPLRLDAPASVPAPAAARGLQAPEVSPSAESELLVFDQAPAVFTSTLPRTIQTVAQLPFPSQQLSALNPMETGICLGVPLQYLPSQFPDEYARWATAPNRATHRITGGESLTDVVQRLTPFVIEMERCRRPVLVCSHLSTLQVLLAYFKGIPVEEAPNIALPMNEVVELLPHQYGWLERRYSFTLAGGADESITSTIGAAAVAAGAPQGGT